MTQGASVGTLSKVGFDVTNPVTKAYEYLGQMAIGKHNTVLATGGIRGTRSHPVERTRAGSYTVGGNLNFNPGPADLDDLLPLITGGAKDGSNNFPLAETLGEFFVTVDKIADVATYAGCKVNKATFKATQGGLLEMDLDIQGKTETLGVVSGFSALVPSLTSPYVFHDCVLTINSVAYQFRHFEFGLDNHLKLDRFMNTISRTDLPALDRTVDVSLDLPFTSDTIGLYDQNDASGAVVATFTNGANSFTITLPAVQFPTQPPNLPGREEVTLPLKGTARKTGTTLEVTLTNI